MYMYILSCICVPLSFLYSSLASYPGSPHAEKWGESLDDLITCPVTYYVHVWFYYIFIVLIIEILPTQSVLSIISTDMICRQDNRSALKGCSLLSS